jgi:LysM repeat protein/lysophospholipase L1-like esterase
MTQRLLKILLLFSTTILWLPVFAQNSPTDTAYLKQSIKYSEFYEFLQYDKNIFEWYSNDAIAPFFEKLKNADKKKVTILHIGDSHIQTDIGTGTTRNLLQSIFGYGGRGMVFPYQAAGTHSTYDYYSEVYGKWASSKNVELKPKLNIGISGITVFTNDSTAGFKIIFRRHYYSIQPDFRKLRVYCHKGNESFDFKVKAGNTGEWVSADCSADSTLPYVEVLLPKASDTITLMVKKTKANQKYFELYGVDIESVQDKGISYTSVGINGAGYHSFFNQNLMTSQLKALHPDLIIFDLGINDFFRGAFNYQYIMSSLNKAIEVFRTNCPDASIMLPNAQDIYFRGVNIANCSDYSTLTRLISKEQNLILYDYYNVSGGRYSMLNWSKTGLSQRDRTHLSFKGYKVKGELYCNAMLNSYIMYLDRKPDSLLVFNDRIDTANFAKWVINKSTYYNRQEIIAADKINNYANNPVNTYVAHTSGQYYTVRSGDNLGSISKRYGVTVSDLQRWNNLSSTRIYAGQKLIVSKTASSTATNKINQTSTTQGAGKINYTIKNGDNLGSIAAKYKVSVADIKKWNGLKSDNIVAGKVLIIYSGSGSSNSTNQTNQTSNHNNTVSSQKIGSYYIVKSGDSLWSIAKKFNTTVEKIKKDNKKTSDKINIGDKLIIK